MIGSYSSGRQEYLAGSRVAGHSQPAPTELSEGDAIRRAQCGDSDAFEHIYKLHCRRVYALCLRMAKNASEAEDLTQDAFLTVFRKIQTFRGEAALSTWLHQIAVNLVRMRRRRKRFLETSTEPNNEANGERWGPSQEPGGPDLQLAGSLDRVNLERAIEKLPPCHKLVVELHDIQGYQHKEIAQIMDWSIGTSKAQLHRARRRLRELLEERLHLGWGRPCEQPR
jgi:RNA polymerase sigma-70 factor (ECF subfamily)